MYRLGLALAGLAALGGAAAASSPDPRDLAIPATDVARAKSLVARLGSARFGEREGAQDDLARMGRLALPALLDGITTHPSPEVRFRCQTLLPKATAADFQARLDTFLADTESRYDHDLPGWNQFHKVAGKTTASRAVFVHLIQESENRELLPALGGSKKEIGDLVAARKQELYVRRYQRVPNIPARPPTVAEVMALVFAESRIETPAAARTISISVLMSSADVRAAILDSSDKGKVYKSLLVHWLDTREDAASLYQGISVATNLNLKEAARVATRLVAMKQATAYYRAQAAFTLVKLESREHLPDVERLLVEEQVMLSLRVANNPDPIQIQLRDSALAACLMLTGQDPEDYGFVGRYKSSGTSMRYNYSNWYVMPKNRPAAFERWKEWREKHQDFEKSKK
jgi:hypothetical protein